jgi:tRNA(adenine34) deaminase
MECAMTSFPLENKLSDTDARYLRDAIRMSIVAKERGNRPFGAVVISKDGQLLAEAYGNTTESGDCTGHAELTAVRIVSPNHTRSVLAQATLYSSAEPCVMCAGAIFWSGIQRVVFGIDAERLRLFRGELLEQKDAALSCRDVFSASSHSIECIGPSLIEEASQVHEGFWQT